jgi:hypothetical protein
MEGGRASRVRLLAEAVVVVLIVCACLSLAFLALLLTAAVRPWRLQGFGGALRLPLFPNAKARGRGFGGFSRDRGRALG